MFHAVSLPECMSEFSNKIITYWKKLCLLRSDCCNQLCLCLSNILLGEEREEIRKKVIKIR